MRVLYSFPHKIGADRICYTAWQQVRGLAKAGADVLLMPGVVSRDLPGNVRIQTTLSRGKLRIPYKVLGRIGSHVLHDHIVARRLRKLAGQVDVVHCWPLASLETLKVAKSLGIPTVLERPNAHTRVCYEAVAQECRRIGVGVPHHEYVPNARVLNREEAEFAACDYLLCPSDFSADSFRSLGFPAKKLLRHQYGFDPNRYFPDAMKREREKKFIALFVGVDAVRKGLHLALDAWLYSPLIKDGIFLIAGGISPEFRKKFASMLRDPSIVDLGHRDDVPLLMRKADVLLMPSIEEGSPLACIDAVASGAVPLASTACNGSCRHMENSLLHKIGDAETLKDHLVSVYKDPSLLSRLRMGAIQSSYRLTWDDAANALISAYESAISGTGEMANIAGVGAPPGATY